MRNDHSVNVVDFTPSLPFQKNNPFG